MTEVNLNNFTGELQTLIHAFDYNSIGHQPETVNEALNILEGEISNNENEDLSIQFNIEKNWMEHHQPTFLLNNQSWINELSTGKVSFDDFKELELPHNVMALQFPKDFSIGGIKLKSCLVAISNVNSNPEFFRDNRADPSELVVRVSYMTEDGSISLKEISLKEFINPSPAYSPYAEHSLSEFEINLFINLCLNFIADFSHDRGTARKTLFGQCDFPSAA